MTKLDDLIGDALSEIGNMPFDSATLLPKQVPYSAAKSIPVQNLVDKLYEGYALESHDRDLISYVYALALAMHGLDRRKTGEHFMTHPHDVARKLIENREDLTTIIAALLHDAVEEKTRKELVSLHDYFVNNHVAQEDQLVIRSELGKKFRERLLKGLEPLLGSFVDDVVPKDQKAKYLRGAERAAMIIELLTRIEGRPWFEHVDRLVGIPDERDWERIKKHGYYMRGPERYGERIRSPAIKIKLMDKYANTKTSTGFSRGDRLFDAFKNLYILSTVKLFLSWAMRNRASPRTFDQAAEYKYFRELLDETASQLEDIAKESRNDPILFLKTPFYLWALRIYDRKYGGLSRVTKPGDVKAKWWEKVLLYGFPLEHFDGTLARYAKRIHDLGSDEVATERQQYKDALLFLGDARKLKDPANVFGFYVSPEMAMRHTARNGG